MSARSTNKLLQLQNEYRALDERTCMLQKQASIKEQECYLLQQKVANNPGDKNLLARYKKTLSDYTSLINNIRRNQSRLVNLQNRISVEYQREQMRVAKANMAAQQRLNRTYQKMYW